MAEGEIRTAGLCREQCGLADQTVECHAIASFSPGPCAGKLTFAEMVAASRDTRAERPGKWWGASIVAYLRESGTTRPDGSKVENGRIIKFSPALPPKLTSSVRFHFSELLTFSYP